MGSLFLLQWIFPTQEFNWGLLRCRQILYQLSYHREAPRRYNSWKLKEECLQEICESNGQRGQERKKRIISSLLTLLSSQENPHFSSYTTFFTPHKSQIPFLLFWTPELTSHTGKKERRKGRKEEERRKMKREFISLYNLIIFPLLNQTTHFPLSKYTIPSFVFLDHNHITLSAHISSVLLSSSVLNPFY